MTTGDLTLPSCAISTGTCQSRGRILITPRCWDVSGSLQAQQRCVSRVSGCGLQGIASRPRSPGSHAGGRLPPAAIRNAFQGTSGTSSRALSVLPPPGRTVAPPQSLEGSEDKRSPARVSSASPAGTSEPLELQSKGVFSELLDRGQGWLGPARDPLPDPPPPALGPSACWPLCPGPREERRPPPA